MSMNVIKQQIKMFLESHTPEVIAISGAWGVGKTYTWKQLLGKARENQQISLEKYAYVSLFGVNSLEAFKYAIFENTIPKDMIGTEANLETFRKNALGTSTTLGKKVIKILSDIPILKKFTPRIEDIAFLSINKQLICIDDLERIGSNLEIKDVLGLIS